MSYSKYYLYKKQYSNDSGVTWYDVTPLEQVPSGSPIATYETLEECTGEIVHVSAVTLNIGSTSIESGNTYQLFETVYPTNATNKSVTWSSSNSGVATVNSSGLVTAVSTGTCTITVTTVDGGYTAQCSVTVEVKEYLTIIAGSASNIKRVGNSDSIQYSKNGGVWTTFTSTNTVSLSSGDKLRLKGNVTPTLGYGVGTFSASTGTFSVSGNAMSLLYGDDFEGQTSLSGKTYAFSLLFCNCTGLTSIDNLVLPATTLDDSCYANMFNGCTSLTTVPSNLLPATTLAVGCYYGMFSGCTSITTAPQLPATNLSGANNCYYGMFYGCTSLTTAPQLPATTLASQCYSDMFRNCTSLTTAPTLPATTLASQCYFQMFNGCTSLSSITCLATNISASYSTYNWVSGVASSGTFTKAASMSSWTTGDSGIPTNWTIQDA